MHRVIYIAIYLIHVVSYRTYLLRLDKPGILDILPNGFPLKRLFTTLLASIIIRHFPSTSRLLRPARKGSRGRSHVSTYDAKTAVNYLE